MKAFLPLLALGLLLTACQAKDTENMQGSGLDAILNGNENGVETDTTSEVTEYDVPHSEGPSVAPDPSLLTPAS